MKIYNTWNEYYESEQDFYLDELNCADCDVHLVIGKYEILGKSHINSYEILESAQDGQTICIIVEEDLDEIIRFLKEKKL